MMSSSRICLIAWAVMRGTACSESPSELYDPLPYALGVRIPGSPPEASLEEFRGLQIARPVEDLGVHVIAKHAGSSAAVAASSCESD